MGKRLIKYFLLILAVAFIADVGYLYWGKHGAISQTKNTLPQELDKIVSGSSGDSANLPQKTNFEAPNGKYVLTEKKEKTRETITQTFLVTPEKGASIELFKKDSPNGDLVSVPFNTFSPNDRYVFLKENDSDKTRYLVFRTDGKSLGKDANYVEVSSLFEQSKYNGYKLMDITGWGGVDLLILNTNNSDGSQGPSFWFEATTNSFIRLNDRFN